MIRLLAAAAVLAVPAASAPRKKAPALAPSVPSVVETPRPDDPAGVTVHRLPNGLTVYLSPNRAEPRIAAWITVRAGSKHDPADSTGMAHYLEHMLFKGSRRLGTVDFQKERPHLERLRELYDRLAKAKDDAGRAAVYAAIDAESVKASSSAAAAEIDKFYASIGARGLNAFTSDERTTYVVDLPSNRLEDWAIVEADRFSAPVFRLFQSEIEAVYEEKNRSLDDAENVLFEEVERRLFKRHPYGTQPTIGTIEHLKRPSLSKMYEYYDRWYRPNNMAIALAGDFDRAKALELLARRFGALEPKAAPALPAWELPPPAGIERSELRHEAEEKVTLAWLTVPATHPDADALAVMDMIMANSTAGLLDLRLNQAQRVKSSGSWGYPRNDAGSWYLWGTAKRGQTLDEVEALLLETVEALKNGEFAEEDVAAVLVNSEIGDKAQLEKNSGRAGLMTDSFTRLVDWDFTVGRLDRLRKVRKEDVVRVARAYLGPDRVAVRRVNGKPEIAAIVKPAFTKAPVDGARQSEFFRELTARKPQPVEPRWLLPGRDYEIVPIEGGRLYAARNPHNDLFALTFRVDRGWRHERRLCHALGLLDLSGAGPWPAEEFKKKLFALGTSLAYECGEDWAQVHLSGLDRNFWPSLELMMQRFDWPRVSSGTLEKMIEVTRGARDDEKRDPDAVHHALGELATRGRESEVLARLSDDELKRLTEEELKSAIRGFPAWTRRVGYVGNRPPREVAKLLETGRRYRDAPPRAPLRYLKPGATRVLFAHRDMVQSRVGLQAAGEVFDPARVVENQFLNWYLGGDSSSLIYQEVRESRALAYSASGGHTVSTRKGDETVLWGDLGCQADKTPEAVSLMLSLLREPPLLDGKFREAATAIEEGYRTGVTPFRAIPYTLMSWEDQGLPPGDPRPARFARVRDFTLDGLKAAASRWKDRPMTVWVLGHRERAGLDQLKALGELEEKGLDALFPY